MTTSYQAKHLPDQSRFVVVTENGESLLSYSRHNDTIDFHHTYVCPNDRGSRVGITLVKAGVDWARNKGYTLAASCWYVARYLDKHPR